MVVKVDRALLALWFANPDTPTVQADEDAVVKALVDRLTTLPDKNNLDATSGARRDDWKLTQPLLR